jgi:lipid-A-disaccharide synthase
MAEFLQQNKLSDKKIIALLPGSRKQEINYLLPDMVAVARQLRSISLL